MRITVCIGSSCHVKGSRQVVRTLQQLIAENKLEDKVQLGGTFCLSNCQKGVCVAIETLTSEEFFSVTPETAEEFFRNNVLPRV